MSCEQCNKVQESGITSYYRWGTADIEITACKKHLQEIYDVLNKIQSANHPDAVKFRIRKISKGGIRSLGYRYIVHNDDGKILKEAMGDNKMVGVEGLVVKLDTRI